MSVAIVAERTLQDRIKRAADLMDKVFKGWERVINNGVEVWPRCCDLQRLIAYCCSDLCEGKIPALVDTALTPTMQELEAGLEIRYARLWMHQVHKRLR